MDITLTLNTQEQQAFLQLVDAALRHAGTGALDVAAHFKAKLSAAAEAQRASADSSERRPDTAHLPSGLQN